MPRNDLRGRGALRERRKLVRRKAVDHALKFISSCRQGTENWIAVILPGEGPRGLFVRPTGSVHWVMYGVSSREAPA